MNIADYIPYGRENAVSRARLAQLTGRSDRSIRDCIKQANKKLIYEGRAILSSSGAKGYWISDDVKEMKGYLKESEQRTRKQFLNDSPIRTLVAQMTGQHTIPVRAHTRKAKPESIPEGQTKLEV